jgi:hypothetical protein
MRGVPSAYRISPQDTKPGSKEIIDSFGSPAVSDKFWEIRGFPCTPHDVVGFVGISGGHPARLLIGLLLASVVRLPEV